MGDLVKRTGNFEYTAPLGSGGKSFFLASPMPAIWLAAKADIPNKVEYLRKSRRVSFPLSKSTLRS
jgi:hypothetical protein